jgi:hypothetical protein
MAGACEAVEVFVVGMCVAPSSSSSPKGEGFGVTPPGFLPELPSENALTPNDLVGCTIEKIARATIQKEGRERTVAMYSARSRVYCTTLINSEWRVVHPNGG